MDSTYLCVVGPEQANLLRVQLKGLLGADGLGPVAGDADGGAAREATRDAVRPCAPWMRIRLTRRPGAAGARPGAGSASTRRRGRRRRCASASGPTAPSH